MLGLDENVPAAQQLWLRKWRIHFRVIGVDVAEWGTEDENLVSVLHRLPQPTFCTLDRDFYCRDLMHAKYCLIWLDVERRQAAEFIRRFLRHPVFETQGKRMGVVARVHGDGITFWRAQQRAQQSISWGTK